MTGLSERLHFIHERLEAAARRSGRDPACVTLVAVSKTQPRERIIEAHALGVRHFGENRVQEALEKLASERPAGLVLHLVGHLQKNKVHRAAELFDAIDSLDSPELAKRLELRAAELGRRMPVLIQVSLACEATKYGLSETKLAPLVEAIGKSSSLELRGLMTLPPYDPDPEKARPYFARLRGLASQNGLEELSMGMSHDYEVAVEEGATEVRIGQALFGPRAPV